ncbi:MAG TPA: YicC/YloC family endoribonuclease [Alphaproteobacteria bacterium]|nr:YicC/YloC family endoribonuclease [Alphaproteobacteria bacterium]
MQPVASMTGFARLDGNVQGLVFAWELRSVNNRGLDLRLRLPPGFEGLEPKLRMEVGSWIRRGSLTAVLTATRPAGQNRFRLNTEALLQILELMRELETRIEADPPRLDGLLGLRGVLEPVEETEDAAQREACESAITSGFSQALEAMVQMRRSEGAALAGLVSGRLEEIARLTGQARGTAALQPAALRGRLRQMVSDLLEASPSLPEDRLAQEAALLIQRADPTEELDRLHAHVEAARRLIEEGGAVGRRLDFLCQELNREANTLCSKASDLELTQIGLAIKAAVEQLREQVQNLE